MELLWISDFVDVVASVFYGKVIVGDGAFVFDFSFKINSVAAHTCSKRKDKRER